MIVPLFEIPVRRPQKSPRGAGFFKQQSIGMSWLPELANLRTRKLVLALPLGLRRVA